MINIKQILNANPDDISSIVILCSNNSRTLALANAYLVQHYQFNNLNGCIGITGYYNRYRISILTYGLGMQAAAMYIYALNQYQVTTIIRCDTSYSLTTPSIDTIFISTEATTQKEITQMLNSPQSVYPSSFFLEVIKKCTNKMIHFGKSYTDASIGITNNLTQVSTLNKATPETSLLHTEYNSIDLDIYLFYYLCNKLNIDVISVSRADSSSNKYISGLQRDNVIHYEGMIVFDLINKMALINNEQ
jgi:purine-nucleoside phosphorylase